MNRSCSTGFLVCVLMAALGSPLWAQSGDSVPMPPGQPSGFPGVSPATGSDMPSIAEKSIDWLQKKLAPPGGDASGSGGSLFSDPAKKRLTIKTAATATLVLSVSLLALFLLRMKPRRRRGGLPEDVVVVLGQIPFGPNQSLRLVRLASKLLLITSSPAGSHTLGEITDPEEVLQIESLCRDGKFDTIGHTLRQRARATATAQSGTGTGRGNRFSAAAGRGRTLLEA